MTRRSRRRRRPKKSSSNNVNVMEKPTTELYGLIIKEKFDEASARCRTHPQDARWDGYKHALPIHLACDFGAPLTLIRNLHESYPEGVRTKDDGGYLPLHIACANEPLDVIRYLHHQYPDGATQRDFRGLTPVDWLRVKNNKKLVGKDRATARAILSPPPGAAAARTTPSTPRMKQPTTTTTPRNCNPAEDDAAITTSSTTAAGSVSIATAMTSAAAAAATTNNTTSRSGGRPHSHVTPRLEEDEVVEVANNLGAEVEAAAATDEDVSNEAGVSTEKPEAAKAEAAASAAAEATVSTEKLEAAEAVSGASGDASMKAREEAARKRTTGKEAARFGRGKSKVTDGNANKLRRKAEVARRGNLRRTAVAANNRMARKREERYKTFAEDREKLSKLPFFFESSSTGHNSSPSVILHDPPP